jgi:hypothetical protein
MNSIKKFFLQLRLKYQKPKTILRKTLNYEQTKHIGFLFYTTHRQTSTTINRFMKELLTDNKEVDALTYTENHAENPYGFKYDICTEKEINIIGQITSPKVKEFINKEFDYLYCVAVEKCDVIDYILRNSKAKCRIGCFDGNNADNFEMMMVLQANEDVDKLIEQIIQYTKKALVAN